MNDDRRVFTIDVGELDPKEVKTFLQDRIAYIKELYDKASENTNTISDAYAQIINLVVNNAMLFN